MRSILKSIVLSLAVLSTAVITTVNAAAPKAEVVRVSKAASTQLRALLAEHPNARAHSIAPTGSMAPTVDENWIVLVEKRDFNRVEEGHIIAYRAEDGEEIMHRVSQKVGISGVRMQGDAKWQREDNIFVTRKHYIGTAFVAIHRTTGEVKNLIR